MTKELLAQYVDLQEEIKDLRRRIRDIESKIEQMKVEGTVFDSVKGTRHDGTIGSIRIEGFPYPRYDEKLEKLYCYKEQLEKAELKAVELTNKVEEYINSIADSRMRRIIRYRYIDKLSWTAVASRIGGNNTAESVKKAFYRFLEKN